MRKEKLPLPINNKGNGENIVQVSFELGDIPMLISALQIGRNTIMMSHKGKAEERMEYYIQVVKKLIPNGWQHFDREEDVSNICIAMANSETWSAHQRKRFRSDKEGRAVITVGNKEWEIWRISDEHYEEAIGFLRKIAPLSCEEITVENVYESTW